MNLSEFISEVLSEITSGIEFYVDPELTNPIGKVDATCIERAAHDYIYFEVRLNVVPKNIGQNAAESLNLYSIYVAPSRPMDSVNNGTGEAHIVKFALPLSMSTLYHNRKPQSDELKGY